MNPELLQIPKRIRELREILDLSTIEVAEKLGVTLDELAQLPTIVGVAGGEEKADAIYAALKGRRINGLVTEDTPRMNVHTVVRKGEGVSVDRYEGYQFESLAFNFMHRSMEPMLVTLEVQEKDPPLVIHGGQEFNFVLEGQVKVTVGKNSFILNEGDSIYFDPKLPHGQSAVGGTTRFLTIINE